MPGRPSLARMGVFSAILLATAAVLTPPAPAGAAGREVLLHGAAAVGMEDVAYPNANGGPALFPVAPSAYVGRCPRPRR